MDTLNSQTPAAAYRHLFLTLRAAIPPTDASPQAAHRRDQAAIAQVAGLCPANMAEATLAAQYAAANAAALDCLAACRRPDTTPADADRLVMRANTMMRRAEGALAGLARIQALRRKRDAEPEAASQAAWAEHAVAAWMGGDPVCQEAGLDPDIRNHETQPAPDEAEATGPDRDDASHAATQNPDDRSRETHPASPTPDPAPRSDPAGASHATTHRPGDRFHETHSSRPAPRAHPAQGPAPPATDPDPDGPRTASHAMIDHPAHRNRETNPNPHAPRPGTHRLAPSPPPRAARTPDTVPTHGTPSRHTHP